MDSIKNNIDKLKLLSKGLKSHYITKEEKVKYREDIKEIIKKLNDSKEEMDSKKEKVKLMLRQMPFNTTNKAIFRMETKKVVKDWGRSLEGFEKHMLRILDTPNAVSELKDYNLVLKGEKSPAMALENYYMDHNLKQYGKDTNKTRIFTELLYTASPNFFNIPGTNDIDLKLVDKWVKSVSEYLEATFGEEYVWGILHLDESTPHIHCMVVGRRYHEKWQKEVVSHAKYFGDKNKLIDLQSSYAEYMQRCGFLLQRGLRGSKATHKEVSQWRAEQRAKDKLIYKQQVDYKELKKEKDNRNKVLRNLCIKYGINPEEVSKEIERDSCKDSDSQQRKEI